MRKLTDRTNGLPLPLWWQVHVPARQRAEALALTLGVSLTAEKGIV